MIEPNFPDSRPIDDRRPCEIAERARLERKIEKMLGQLLRRLAVSGAAPDSALSEVERRAVDLNRCSVEIDLATPAFHAERITYLGRAAAILVRQADKVASQFPGTDSESLILEVTSAASEKLSRANSDLSAHTLPKIQP